MLKKVHLNFFNIAYICLVIVYMAIREVLPLNFLIDSTMVSASIFAIGLPLIVWDFFSSKKCIRGIAQDLLILFLLICSVSTLINRDLGVFDNLKFIAALAIEFLIFFCFSKDMTPDKKKTALNAVSVTLIVTWFILTFVSFLMYLFSIDIIVYGHGAWGETNQGFSFEYTRLWGIFQDPNYASITSIVSIMASVRLIASGKNIIVKILLGINIAVQFFYIILGGSRAALLLMILAILLFSAYKFILPAEKNKKNIFPNFAKCVLSVVFSLCLIFTIKTGLPYVKAYIFADKTALSDTLSDFYGELYSLSGFKYEITNQKHFDVDVPENEETTVPQEPSTTEEPSTTGESTTTEEPYTKPPINIDTIERNDIEETDISNGRFLRWKQTVEVFLNAPIFGTSPRNLTLFARLNNPDTIIAKFGIAPHNGYLDVLVETGIVGFITLGALFILALYTALRNFIKTRFSVEKAFIIVSVIILAGVAMFISDIFMIFSINSVLFWLLFGFAYNYENRDESQGIIYRMYNQTLAVILKKAFSGKGKT